MSFLFGKRQSPDEMLRENQRSLNKAMREIDRERKKIEVQEQKVIFDIKQMAKKGQMDAVRILAKDLIRTRRQLKKFLLMRANIQAVSLKITTLKSQNSMANAMKGHLRNVLASAKSLVSRAMMRMNCQLNIPQVTKIMQDFERQSQMLEMKEEILTDAIDEAMIGSDEDEEQEESDRLVQQVLDELGIELSGQLNALGPILSDQSAGMEAVQGNRQVVADTVAGGLDDDLEARLNALRKN